MSKIYFVVIIDACPIYNKRFKSSKEYLFVNRSKHFNVTLIVGIKYFTKCIK